MALIDLLVPTRNRPAALAVTLAGLASQSFQNFRVVISDQTDPLPGQHGAQISLESQALVRVLRARGNQVETYHHMPRRGMAEHRHYLLSLSTAPYVVFVDDDLILEPHVLDRLYAVMREEGCGFVGAAAIGLSHVNNLLLQEQKIEFWDGPVAPEVVRPGEAAWRRQRLHNAANLWHMQKRLKLKPETQRVYKVAWVGGCVLYDAQKLRTAGGFDFWQKLPESHCGEDVLAQIRVMEKFGGCAIIPSGVYHQELPTTLPDRDVSAPEYLLGSATSAPAPVGQEEMETCLES